MEIYERLKDVRAKLNISQREFAKRIFFSQSLYAEIELGRRNVNNRVIQLVSSQFNVNKDWIKTGKGEMFAAPPPDIKLEQLTEIFLDLDDMLQDYLLLQSQELLKIQKEKITKSQE